MSTTAVDRPQVISLPNGEKVTPMFSPQEMDRRLARLRTLMAELDLEAVLFTSYHNINYYADFLYCSFGRPYGLIVTADGQTSISANIDYGQPYRRTYGENVVYTDWQRDNYFRAIEQVLPRVRRMGIECDHATLQLGEKLERLPSRRRTRRRQRGLHARTYDQVAGGDRGDPQRRQDGGHRRRGGGRCNRRGCPRIRGGARRDSGHGAGDRQDISPVGADGHVGVVPVGHQYRRRPQSGHEPARRQGDILSLNCFPMIQGYYTALERTLFFGHCDEASLRHWEINVEVHERGLELISPGARCCDIAAELNEIYRGHGVLEHRTFGYGHSFGVLSHYYGREAGLELREDIDTVLEPGMVVSIEPMISIPDGEAGAGGYREHDILLVTDAGAEDITKFPYGPAHNIIKG